MVVFKDTDILKCRVFLARHFYWGKYILNIEQTTYVKQKEKIMETRGFRERILECYVDRIGEEEIGYKYRKKLLEDVR